MATCDGSISNDDSLVDSSCGHLLTVNTPDKGVNWDGHTPINDSTCYFEATAGGADVTPAGIAAGVTVVAWIAHNGTFVGGTTLGSKGHFEVQCGAPGQECPPTSSLAPDPSRGLLTATSPTRPRRVG